jgi:large subunit ribosomal protein L1
MAKKQPAAPAEGGEETKAAPAPAEKSTPAGGETKKPRAPKKEPKEKTAPAAPAAASPAPAAAPAAPAAPAAAGEPGAKKKGKQPGRPPRRGKKLRNLMKSQLQNILKEGAVPLKKAVSMLKSLRKAKFDQTVEVHMWLGVDTTQNDQMVRGSVPLPHGIGKSVRVLVFCQGDNVAKAKEAGADFAGSDDLIKQIQGGWLEFDIALATQDMMGQVSRLGRVLGPRGLMPTPKAGTVITAGADVGAAVREFKAGKVEYRADKGGNVHAGVGKMSFDEDKLVANISAFIEQVQHAKPAGVKGNYIKSITIAATMSPGIPVAI